MINMLIGTVIGSCVTVVLMAVLQVNNYDR